MIEPEQRGAATIWRYGEQMTAAFADLADGCERCRPDIPCYRHEGDTFDVEFVDYQGLRLEGENGATTDCGVAMSLDCVGCGTPGTGGALVVSPGGMLASACEACIERVAAASVAES